MSNQVQCEKCLCTLYFTDGGMWGVTGELCSSCQAEADDEAQEYWDDLNDD